MISRRGALTALGLVPLAAEAQDAAPQPAPQAIPPVTPVTPPARMASSPAAAIDRTKIYFVYFEQTIDVASMRALRKQLASLVEAGVSQITIVVSSAGGLIEPTLNTYNFIRSLPATITTHAESFVQSAATVLFLAGATRTASPSATFLFHPSTASLAGAMNEQQIQERLTQMGTVQTLLAAIYHDRTSLTPAQIQDFARREVILTATQAEQAGIVSAVSDLHIPGGQAARIVFLD